MRGPRRVIEWLLLALLFTCLSIAAWAVTSAPGTGPPVGTEGATVGLLNSDKIDSGNNMHTGDNVYTGAVQFQGPVDLGSGPLGDLATKDAAPAETLTGNALAPNVTGSNLTNLAGGPVGTAAYMPVGVTGHVLAPLDADKIETGNNTHTGQNTFNGLVNLAGAAQLAGTPFGALATANAAPAATLTGTTLASAVTAAPGLATLAGGNVGSAAYASVGASGAALGMLNANKTDSGSNNFSGPNTFNLLGTCNKGTLTVGASFDSSACTGQSNSSWVLPQGSVANRPVTPVVGMERFNTDSGYNSKEVYQFNRSYSGVNVAGWNPTLGATYGAIDVTQAPYSCAANNATDCFTNQMLAIQTGRDLYIPHSNAGLLFHDMILAYGGASVYGANSNVTAPFGSNFIAMIWSGNGNQFSGIRAIDTTTSTAPSNLARITSLSAPAAYGATSVSINPDASFTASIGGTFTGTSSGTTALSVSGLSGCVWPGDKLTGSGSGLPTTIVSVNASTITGTCSGSPALVTAAATTLAAVGITDASNEMAVTAVASGTVAQNQTVLGTGLPTPPMVGEGTTVCTSVSSFPCFQPLVDAIFTYVGASNTTLTASNVIGTLAAGETLTGGINPNTPAGITAGTVINSQNSGIAVRPTGGIGSYVTNQNLVGAGAGIATLQTTVASTALQSTGVHDNMRAHVLLDNGTHDAATVQAISGLTVTLTRPLSYSASAGDEFLATFGAVYLACGASYFDVDKFTLTGGWGGVYADCPNPSTPLSGGFIRNVNMTLGKMFISVTGRNVDGALYANLGSNLGYSTTVTANGDGATTAFTVPYHIWGQPIVSFLVVKVGGVTKTWGADYTYTMFGTQIIFRTPPPTGVGNVTITYHPLTAEVITMDNSGAGSPTTAGNVWTTVIGGGGEVPCLFRTGSSSGGNNMANGFICGPGNRATAEWDGQGSFAVSNFQSNYSDTNFSIINGSALNGELLYAQLIPNDVADGEPGYGYQIDPGSGFLGHIRYPSKSQRLAFVGGNLTSVEGTPLPPSTSGSCTVAGSPPAGALIIPCSAQSGINAGQVASATLPTWSTIRGAITPGSFTATSTGTPAMTVAGLVGCVHPNDVLTGTGTGLPAIIDKVNGSYNPLGSCAGTATSITTIAATTLSGVAVTALGTDPLCQGNCIVVSAAPTTPLTNGQVLTFAGPLQPQKQPSFVACHANGLSIATTNTTETNLASCPIIAGLLGINSEIVVDEYYTQSGTGTGILSSRWSTTPASVTGGMQFLTNTLANTVLSDWEKRTVRNAGAANLQVAAVAASLNGPGTATSLPPTGAINTAANPAYVNINGSATAGETLTLTGYKVTVYP